MTNAMFGTRLFRPFRADRYHWFMFIHRTSSCVI